MKPQAVFDDTRVGRAMPAKAATKPTPALVTPRPLTTRPAQAHSPVSQPARRVGYRRHRVHARDLIKPGNRGLGSEGPQSVDTLLTVARSYSSRFQETRVIPGADRHDAVHLGLYVNNRSAVFLGDEYTLSDLIDMARLAEAYGFDFVSVGDSLLAKPRFSPLVTLAGIATVTERIGLTTGILQPHMRNPVLPAQEAATLDHLAAGRTSLGLGLGTGPKELVRRNTSWSAIPSGVAARLSTRPSSCCGACGPRTRSPSTAESSRWRASTPATDRAPIRTRRC